jgi:hypothetical protein
MVKLPWIPAESEWRQLPEMFRTEPIRNQLLLGLYRRLRNQTRAYGRRPRRQLGAVPDHGREPQARRADLAAGDAVPQPGLMVAGERTAHRATTSGATRVPNVKPCG